MGSASQDGNVNRRLVSLYLITVTYVTEGFGIVSGTLNVEWDQIARASNVSHTVVLHPLKAGYFNFTSATITYLAEDGLVV